MSRRKTVSNLMRVAIDDKSAYDFAWALLELARKEYNEQGKFSNGRPKVDFESLKPAYSAKSGKC